AAGRCLRRGGRPRSPSPGPFVGREVVMELFKWLRLQWDRVFGIAFVVIGAVALLTGWSKVSATPYPAEQIPYVVSAGLGGLFLLALSWAAVSGQVRLADQARYTNVAVAGLLLAGIGNGLYIMALRRSLEQRLRRVHDRIDSRISPEKVQP